MAMEALDFHVEITSAGPDSYAVTARAPDGAETAATLHLPVTAGERLRGPSAPSTNHLRWWS